MRLIPIGVVLAVIVLSSCSSSVSQWEMTQYQDTLSAYQEFVSEFPESPHLKDAQIQIDRLSYRQASRENTTSSLATYLEKFPKGQFVGEAELGLQQLLYDQASTSQKATDYELYLSRFPEGKFEIEMRAGLDNADFKEANSQYTIQAFRHYLQRHPSGQYAEQAKYSLRELPLINACLDRKTEKVANLLNSGVTLADSDRGARLLIEVVQERLRTFIRLVSGPTGSSTTLVSADDVKKVETLQQFTLLLKANANPNRYRISGMRQSGVTEQGNAVSLSSTGHPGFIVSANQEGITLGEYIEYNGLTDFARILRNYGG